MDIYPARKGAQTPDERRPPARVVAPRGCCGVSTGPLVGQRPWVLAIISA
jgi:hypothetical protein